MKRTKVLSHLFMEELSDLLNGECQWGQHLPHMAQAAQSTALKAVLGHCQDMTQKHVVRLKDIFADVRLNPQAPECTTMRGLIAEGEVILQRATKDQTTDAAMIGVAQRVQQYEIERYKTAREHAADLDHALIVELLTKTLNEVRAMNFRLNELSQNIINAHALKPSAAAKRRTLYRPRAGIRKKSAKRGGKRTEIYRFINEGNPNTQNPEEEGDLS